MIRKARPTTIPAEVDNLRCNSCRLPAGLLPQSVTGPIEHATSITCCRPADPSALSARPAGAWQIPRPRAWTVAVKAGGCSLARAPSFRQPPRAIHSNEHWGQLCSAANLSGSSSCSPGVCNLSCPGQTLTRTPARSCHAKESSRFLQPPEFPADAPEGIPRPARLNRHRSCRTLCAR